MTPLDALQEVLAAEHAAVHVLATLGGATSASKTPGLHALLSTLHSTHRGRREQLVVMVRNAGGDPVAARAAYALPDTSSVGAVRRAAVDLEQSCCTTYAAAVAATAGEQRDWAVMTLSSSALALLDLDVEPAPFPGAPDLG